MFFRSLLRAGTLALVLFSCVLVSRAQVRQTRLYIDDGSGNFTILKAAPGGGTVTFPSSGTLSTGSSLAYLVESYLTSGQYSATSTGEQLLATDASATNISIALQPKGTGALEAQIADGTAAGGSPRGQYAVDWQTVRSSSVYIASGAGSVISGGQYNVSSGAGSTVGGGTHNSSTQSYTTVGGGNTNTSGTQGATVAGGENNNAGGSDAAVGGGWANSAGGGYSAIAGGTENLANATYAAVVGGITDSARAVGAFVGGGNHNVASGACATVAGGINNTASGSEASAWGVNNVASGNFAVVAGDRDTSSGAESAVVGGAFNIASGEFSSVLGGTGLTLSGTGAFGYLSGNTGPLVSMSVSAAHVGVFGDVDLWLANNDNTARALYFYAPNSTTGAFSTSTDKYVGFKAGAVSTSVIWTLPTSDGGSGNVLSTDGSGNLGWSSPSSGLGAYAYVYDVNTGTGQAVSAGSDVTFSANGPLSNITHTAGTSSITVSTAGVYKIDYKLNVGTVTSGVPVGIAVNGTLDASTETKFLSTSGEITGSCIISLAAGDVITLRNNSGSNSFTTTTSPDAAAAITIIKLS